jgi:hypothetical protein
MKLGMLMVEMVLMVAMLAAAKFHEGLPCQSEEALQGA